MNITGLEAYQLYTALKLHFTTSYDFFKYGGKVSSATVKNFEINKGKFFFYKLSRKYKREELFGFYVANLLKNPKVWAGELVTEDADSEYKVWLRTQQSLSYIFDQDLSHLLEQVSSPNDMLKVVDGQYPLLYNEHLQNKVCIETIVILNDILGFFPMWKKKVEDDIIFPDFMKRCEKYRPFLHYDQVKFKKTLKDKICQYA